MASNWTGYLFSCRALPTRFGRRSDQDIYAYMHGMRLEYLCQLVGALAPCE